MRNVTLLLLFCSVTLTTNAQGVFSNKTNLALQQVIQDYPNHFDNIKGDRLAGKVEMVSFNSKVQIPGAQNCVLNQYTSTAKKVSYGWRCELFGATDFNKAKEKFTELYNEIRNTIVKIDGEKPFILNGSYEIPSDKKTTVIAFQLLPIAGNMQRLRVELTLQQTSNWTIMLDVFDQDASADLAATGSTR